MGDGHDSVVRRFRRRSGLTQEELAARSGVSVRTIRGLETGDRRNPQLASVRQLADAMDLAPDDRDELMTSVMGATVAAAEAPWAPRQLPAAPSGFTGREAQLTVVGQAVDATRVAAIAGAGGIGKTWLALHWAHRHLDRFPDGQLFVDLRGFSPDGDPIDPLTALRGFLDALGVDPARVPGGVAERAARYRSEVAGKRMLIVLDNAATADQVVPLLPGTPTCTVLVTSRRTLTALLRRHGAYHVPLDALDEDEAHALLAYRLGTEFLAADSDAVADLIRLCGRYPLALSIMASRAHVHPEVPLAEFADELRDVGLDALDDDDPAASLPALLSWSVRALTAEQRTVFALLGIAPGADIGLPAAASLTAMSTSGVLKLLRELEQASLLTRQASNRYSMHDLIRAYASDRDLDAGVRDSALRRVLDFYVHTAHAAAQRLDPQTLDLDPPAPGVRPDPAPDVPAALAWFDAERPNLLAAQHIAAGRGWHLTVWQLAWTMNSFLHRRGHHHDRLTVWLAALDASVYLPDPTTRTSAHRYLGRAHAALGQFDEGIAHLDQAVALAEEQHDTLQQAHTHRMLAGAWDQRGDDQRSLEHTARALELYRTLDEPVWEADALNALGWHQALLGQYDTARTHCEAALALQRRHRYPDGTAAALDSLGYIAHHTGRHEDAVNHYRQAIALFRDLGNNAFAAVALDGVGHPLAALGHSDQAAAAWREALQLFEDQGNDDDAKRVRRQLDTLGAD